MVGTGDGHACCWAWSACRVAPRWLVGRASRSPKRLALILRIDASSERKGVGSARVLRWRPRGVDGGICPKRDAADPEPEPARRPGDGDGAGDGAQQPGSALAACEGCGVVATTSAKARKRLATSFEDAMAACCGGFLVRVYGRWACEACLFI